MKIGAIKLIGLLPGKYAKACRKTFAKTLPKYFCELAAEPAEVIATAHCSYRVCHGVSLQRRGALRVEGSAGVNEDIHQTLLRVHSERRDSCT